MHLIQIGTGNGFHTGDTARQAPNDAPEFDGCTLTQLLPSLKILSCLTLCFVRLSGGKERADMFQQSGPLPRQILSEFGFPAGALDALQYINHKFEALHSPRSRLITWHAGNVRKTAEAGI